jgi:hypothetical protein
VGSTLTHQELLAPWQGGLLLAVYGLVLAGAGAGWLYAATSYDSPRPGSPGAAWSHLKGSP